MMATVSKREQAKEGRRQRIMDAAEAYIEESGSTEFSMRQLGARAGVSPFTTYNLIGQKADVLYSLLNRSLDDIDSVAMMNSRRTDPVEFLFKAGEAIVQVFTARPELYRPLLRYLLGSIDSAHRPAFMSRSSAYWRFAYAPLDEAGYLDGPIKKIDLVRETQMFFTGVLEYWVHGDLSHQDFSEHVRQGFSIRMLALGIPELTDDFVQNIADARPGIIKLIGE